MPLTDVQNPGERKKLIGAIVLGLLAIILLWWAFFGFGSTTTSKTAQRPTPRPTPAQVPRGNQTADNAPVDVLDQLQPVNISFSLPSVPEAKRNIFVYYEKPIPVATPPPSPTPTPTPPVLLAGISPTNVYARTGDFTLEVAGDKFTPQVKVLMDGTVLQTRYMGAQQLSVNIPASAIANPGSRQITLRSADGTLYSNTLMLNVAAPPTPNFSYVGIIGSRRYIDTAILQDKSSREMLNVQRGDLLGGRFRVTSIAEKELVVMDNTLKIRHSIPFTVQGDRGNPLQRPTPRIESEDDEP